MRLRRSVPYTPGLQRRRTRGKSFKYFDVQGTAIADDAELARINELAIPPAWVDVWICPTANGHIQAVGTDAAGRRQYLYHPAWRAQQDAIKHERTLQLGLALPVMRRTSAQALRRRSLCQARVLGAVFRMLDTLAIRIGSEAYAAEHDSYGLATLKREHVQVHGRAVELGFRGKSGVEQSYRLVDAGLARVCRQLLTRSDPSNELFAWSDGERWHDVTSADINAYIRESSGHDFTAKDFRTWNATVLMAQTLALQWHVGDRDEKPASMVRRSYAVVAEYLGNTPAIARQSYVDSRVLDLFNDGVVLPMSVLPAKEPHLPIHEAVERALLEMLQSPRRPGSTRAS